MNILDGLVVQRQTSPLPHAVDVQGLTTVLLLLEGFLARLVSGIFLGISKRTLFPSKKVDEEGLPGPTRL